MKTHHAAEGKSLHALLALLLCLLVTGCEYDVPVTNEPTGAVDPRLIGEWIGKDGWIKVRGFDATSYAIFHDGRLYRAWHSAVANLPVVSVQDIDTTRRKFFYLSHAVSDDGQRLTLRVANDTLIPDDTKDAARVRQLFEEHAANPGLFGEAIVYFRQ